VVDQAIDELHASDIALPAVQVLGSTISPGVEEPTAVTASRPASSQSGHTSIAAVAGATGKAPRTGPAGPSVRSAIVGFDPIPRLIKRIPLWREPREKPRWTSTTP
jgi:hypothetical protein